MVCIAFKLKTDLRIYWNSGVEARF